VSGVQGATGAGYILRVRRADAAELSGACTADVSKVSYMVGGVADTHVAVTAPDEVGIAYADFGVSWAATATAGVHTLQILGNAILCTSLITGESNSSTLHLPAALNVGFAGTIVATNLGVTVSAEADAAGVTVDDFGGVDVNSTSSLTLTLTAPTGTILTAITDAVLLADYATYLSLPAGWPAPIVATYTNDDITNTTAIAYTFQGSDLQYYPPGLYDLAFAAGSLTSVLDTTVSNAKTVARVALGLPARMLNQATRSYAAGTVAANSTYVTYVTNAVHLTWEQVVGSGGDHLYAGSASFQALYSSMRRLGNSVNILPSVGGYDSFAAYTTDTPFMAAFNLELETIPEGTFVLTRNTSQVLLDVVGVPDLLRDIVLIVGASRRPHTLSLYRAHHY